MVADGLDAALAPCWCVQVDPEELRRLKRVDAAAISQKKKLSEMDVLAVVQNDSTYLEVRGAPRGSPLLPATYIWWQ